MNEHWFADTMCCDNMIWLLQHHIVVVTLYNKYHLTLHERVINYCPFCGSKLVIRDET